MSLLWELFWFVIAVGLLVTVHEFGHFWVARRLGFKVLRFSVGFGKPLLKHVAGPDRVEYVLAAIPLGGYVKLLDEREAPVPPAELARSFTRRPVWQRILVLLAGPAFNLIFAVVLLWGMLWVGGVTQVRPLVGDVTVGSLADRAGLRSGDLIQSVNGEAVADQGQVQFALLDAMSARGEAALAVRGADGGQRTAVLSVTDAAQRRHLTEPSQLPEGIGFQFWMAPMPAVLAKVEPNGPAARAGLVAGDTIVAVGGAPIKDFREVSDYIHARPGERISLDYRRAGVVHSVELQTVSDSVNGKRIGRIMVEPQLPKFPDSMLVHTALSPVAALGQAVQKSWQMTVLQGRFFWRMIAGRVSLKNLNGPVSIAQFAGDSAHEGLAPFLSLLVYLSLSLGFLNLLPIPILDGGQIVYQAAEWLKGSPLSERTQAFGQQVGLALLIVLMSVALYNDFARQFG